MIVHGMHRHEVSLQDDVSSLWYKLHEEPVVYQSHDRSHRGHPHVNFSHPVGTYDAGYYSSSCSLSFADDLFMEIFGKDPHNQNAWI
ncbi:uncharacterized protein FRV6_16587 [Fusarium oxysporum]|uniref:Uncharacterized protein n=1 Tax=Fusarium oxysporum TaxID=5507 RepID=A0A2H3UF63_FUSOX|nr:uncharacterized protein FRV6_16587 [Fusarium oxysporum]